MNATDVSSEEIRPGAVLAGRYRIERTLGAGGMGVVVSARHIQLGHRVAIKFLGPNATRDSEAMHRFMREAWTAAQLTSPHVVKVSDIASLPSGAPFIVMEYLEGEDLARLLARRGALPVSEAVGLLSQVCDAIGEAHALGVVHRDLKPSNLFCVYGHSGHVLVKVLDFGVSKLLRTDFEDPGITTTRTTLGSPLYMPPEQMSSSKAADARADVWSLGVILHELLTGQHPFPAHTLPELAIKIATTSPTPLRALRPELPAELEAVVLRCLARERDQRFAHATELANALCRWAPRDVAVSQTRVTPAPPAVSPVAASDTLRSRPLRRYALVAGVVTALAAIALAALWSSASRPPPAVRPARAQLAPTPPAAASAPPSALPSGVGTPDEPPPLMAAPAAVSSSAGKPRTPRRRTKPESAAGSPAPAAVPAVRSETQELGGRL